MAGFDTAKVDGVVVVESMPDVETARPAGAVECWGSFIASPFGVSKRKGSEKKKKRGKEEKIRISM
jgi:hypothetical protein